MRILYVSVTRLPSERAHGHQIAQVCSAMHELGHSVQILAPMRKNVITESFWEYYGAHPEIAIEYAGAVDWLSLPLLPKYLGFLLMQYQFRHELQRYVHDHEFDCIYTRNAFLVPDIKTSTPVILELHSIPKMNRSLFVRACNSCKAVSCLTRAMADDLIAMGVRDELVHVEPDAVDLSAYQDPMTTEAARNQLGISTKRIVVGYVGRLKTLGMDKGVSDLLKALKKLQSEERFLALIVGGPDADKAEYEKQAAELGLTADDVRFTGNVSRQEVPTAMFACDILTMPWPDKPHYRRNMSPLKMFEYMAAHRPVLTGDLPTIREVLDEKTAYFSQPDSPDSIASQLTNIADHPAESQKIADAALALVQQYSWVRRMERVLRYVA